VTRASSEAAAPAASRIIASEALQQAVPVGLDELSMSAAGAPRRLTSRDLDNEVARAAYALGRRRGYELGARAGLQQGFSEGSQALQEFQSRKAADIVGQLQQITDAFRSEMKALESQVATDLVSLAIDIARQVLRREPATDPGAVLPAAREALRMLGEGASTIEVSLNPADAGLLSAQWPADAPTLRLAEDPTLPRGSCRIDADTGITDAGFEARWQAVMASLGRDEEPLP
jgi:flagellar assembly protein FliH